MDVKRFHALAAGVCAAGLGAFLAQAAAPPSPQGVITAKAFFNIGGGVTIPDLTGSPKFPDNPDLVAYPPYFEFPFSGDINTPPPADVYNNYGVQIIGYFYPPTTGDYIFKIAADDNAQLYLSTDADPANKKLIAIEPEWNPVRDFDGTSRRNATNPQNNSQTWTGTEWPTKDPVMGGAKITLTAGRAYYIEALMKEGGGGDNLAVAVQDPAFLIDASLPIPGQYLSSFDKNSGPVTIVTQPADATVDEGRPVSFTVEVDGTPPYTYQWKKNGADITDATNKVYSIPYASFADNGAKFSVAVTGAQGSATSAQATLTVNRDTTPPTLVRASGGGDFVSVTVRFSERVDPTSATTPGNYSISGGISVSGAVMVNETTVRLTTSRQTGGQRYTLTVNNVRDMASVPNTIAPNSTIEFNSAVFKTGLVAWERYNGGGSITQFIEDIANNALPPPDVTWTTSLFESGRGLADNYRGRGYAWFKPATTGNYVFIITADDNARLFLSTDDNPANKKAIAAESSWSNNREWSSAGEEQRSDSYTETEWPNFWTITLQAGRSYYLEALWQEGGGGDGCEVTILREGDPTPANGTPASTAGGELGIFVDPSSLPPVITQPPAGLVTYKQGDTLTWTVVADSVSPMTYQWYRNKIAIPGATSATLTIPNAGIESVGDYSVAVSNENGTTVVNGGPADDQARAIMENAFLIECEDWNYNGGQTVPAASTMPYLGGAYDGLSAVLDVDFWNDGDESGGAAFDYNRHQPSDEGVIELKGGTNVAGDPEQSGDAVANPLGRARGRYNNATWEVRVNYAVGWTDAGDWQNYTRTIPKGKYNAVLAAAHDGLAANEINMILYKVANPTIPDGSAAGAPGKQQGVTELGRFLGQGTGAWSSNDFFPLRKSDGSLSVIEADGNPMTLRLEFNSADGDADFILLYPVAEGPAQPGTAKIARSANNVVISEDPPAGSTVQSATSVTGPWTDVGPAPQTIAITGETRFFRLKR